MKKNKTKEEILNKKETILICIGIVAMFIAGILIGNSYCI